MMLCIWVESLQKTKGHKCLERNNTSGFFLIFINGWETSVNGNMELLEVSIDAATKLLLLHIALIVKN